MGYLSGENEMFGNVYPDLIKPLQRAMLTFTESIRKAHQTAPRLPLPGPEMPRLAIQLTEDGYPVLPDNLVHRANIRSEQERLMKQYLSRHYGESHI